MCFGHKLLMCFGHEFELWDQMMMHAANEFDHKRERERTKETKITNGG